MIQPRGAYGPPRLRRDKYKPSDEPSYRRKLYAEKRAREGFKRKYTPHEFIDYMPIAKERVLNDPLRTWITGPELWK